MQKSMPLSQIILRWKPAANGCLEWTGARSTAGYPYAVFDGRNQVVTRLVWAALNGPIPPGMVICHRCDNPPCINPEHLFLGSSADNIHDMIQKGRNKRLQKMRAVVVDGRIKCRECDVEKDVEQFGMEDANTHAQRRQGIRVLSTKCLECTRRLKRRFEAKKRERGYPIRPPRINLLQPKIA